MVEPPTKPLTRAVFDWCGRVWLVKWGLPGAHWDHVTLTMNPRGPRVALIKAPTPGGILTDPHYGPSRAREAAGAHGNPHVAAALREAADIGEAWERDGTLPEVG